MSVDVRLIASSGSGLEDALEGGRFRKDLYFRIDVVSLHVKPLRERPGDPTWLARRFLREVAGPEPEFDPRVFPLLEAYDWPGNVWELRRVVEHCAAVGRGRRIGPGSLPASVRASGAGRRGGPAPDGRRPSNP